MEREQIIKALELHSQGAVSCLHECPYGNLHNCGSAMARDVLYFIEELTEEKNKAYAQGVLDFAERIKNYYSHLPGGTLPAAVEYHVEQIAKEMLEGVITDKNSQE